MKRLLYQVFLVCAYLLLAIPSILIRTFLSFFINTAEYFTLCLSELRSID